MLLRLQFYVISQGIGDESWFSKSIILTWEEFLTSIFPECRSLCNNPLTCNSWIAMHISMAIFMAVRNGTEQCAKNFLNAGQHDSFVSHKSSIKIYRGTIKPNTNRKFSWSAITIAFLRSANASTNRHLLETFFTAIRWFKLIIQPLKTLSNTLLEKQHH